MPTGTEVQMRRRLDEIMDRIEAENPYETFEPHESEEGVFNIRGLYEARLNKLFIDAVLNGPDKELASFLMLPAEPSRLTR